jgi:hypothetical protein
LVTITYIIKHNVGKNVITKIRFEGLKCVKLKNGIQFRSRKKRPLFRNNYL